MLANRRFGPNCGTTIVMVSLGWRCAEISSMLAYGVTVIF
jgi:hypothetical protein